jgi:hypothetical protein
LSSESIDAEDHGGPVTDQQSPTRRNVVRAGVWSVPAVAVATAAPASAVTSGGAGQLIINTFNAYGDTYNSSGNPTEIQSQFKVYNSYVVGAGIATNVNVVISYPDDRFSGAAPTHVSGSGWVFAGASHSVANHVWYYTFTYAGTLDSQHSQETSKLQYNVPLSVTPPGTITLVAVAHATGSKSATATASYTRN